jgi:hypothetical protein
MGGNAQQSRRSRARGGPRSRGFSVQHCGIAKAPAERLGLSINARVRRRFDGLERQIGATHDVHGTHLTGEGAQVVSAVECMQAASFELIRASRSATDMLSARRHRGL